VSTAAPPRTRSVATQHRAAPAPLQLREEPGGALVVSGTAVVFNSWISLAGGAMERLLPGSADRALAEASDLFLAWNHDYGEPLARRGSASEPGGLDAWTDERGLHFRARLADTTRGRDVAELLRTGVVRAMSFGFRIGQEDVDEHSGKVWYSIRELSELIEISVVTRPAYPTTSAQLEEYARARGEDPEAVRRRVERALGAVSAPARSSEPAQARRSPYGPGSRWSWFMDKALLAEQEAARDAGFANIGGGVVADPRGAERSPAPVPILQAMHGWSPEGASNRLKAAAQERAVGTSATFVPVDGAPGFVSSRFAIGARNAAVLYPLLPREQIVAGTVPEIPRLSGATVLGQTEGAAVSDTDPTSAMVKGRTVTIAGEVDLSMFLFEQAGQASNLDAAIAQELGSLIALELDRQLIAGSGAGVETQGLVGLSGVTAATYTDASPTGAELLMALAQLHSQTHTARGRPPSVAILHARRWAWLVGSVDSSLRPIVEPEAYDSDDVDATAAGPVGTLATGERVYATTAVPTTLGGGTEDRVILLIPDDLVVFSRDVQVKAAIQPGIATLTVKVVAYQYVASVLGRYPAGVGVLSGSGLAAPAGY